MLKKFSGLLAVFVLIGWAGAASAALITFTDRAAWQTAASGGTGDLFEDFNSYTSDVMYGPAPVSAGFLTLSVADGTSDNSWTIDANADAFGSIPNVNGTTFITTLGLNSPSLGDTLISFGSVSALGFDYSGASYSNADGMLTTSLGDTVNISHESTGSYFLGLLYTDGEAFTSLQWNSSGSFAAGVDNVEAFSASTAVPAPASISLLSIGLLGLGISRRRKAKS
jgi:hypothetical protein